VPRPVLTEAARHGPVTSTQLTNLGNVRLHDVGEARLVEFQRGHDLGKLHSGEVACLFFCRELGVPLMLCDDLAGRDAAAGLGMTPVGSLGVVVRAFRRGLIPRASAERAMVDLYDVSTLFVTRAVVDIALAELARRAP